MSNSIAEQIWDLRRTFKVTQELWLDFPDGTRRCICPLGVAWGFDEFSNRGHPSWPSITCWPKSRRFAVWYGYNEVAEIHSSHGSRLWPLEVMVYVRERAVALTRAMEELDKLAPLPRLKGHLPYDTQPFPEDFKWTPKRTTKSSSRANHKHNK